MIINDFACPGPDDPYMRHKAMSISISLIVTFKD